MGFTPLFCLTVMLVIGVVSSDTGAKKRCIKGKYEESLGQSFTDCYNTKQSLEIARIKQCYQDIMKTNNVVKTANNGQMTVDRENFRTFATQNNKPVQRAMQGCYNSTTADDAMYQEAARASQCVFDRVKTTC